VVFRNVGCQMKTEDQYLKFVRWSEADTLYVGYIPDLFPRGGVCHGESEEGACHQLCVLLREEVQQLPRDGKELPVLGTRPTRAAVPA
jgi:hypothetical protein